MLFAKKLHLFAFLASIIFLFRIDYPANAESTASTIGHGDGQIHIISSLSAPSIKNGEKLKIQSVVKAAQGVAKVQAQIVPECVQEAPRRHGAAKRGLDKLVKPVRDREPHPSPLAILTLAPVAASLGGVNSNGTLGMWEVEWAGAGLTEGYYQVVVTVTDRMGHSFVDSSLRFSDPIAGYNAVGTSAYPNGGLRHFGTANLFGEEYFRSAVIDTTAGYAYFGTYTSPGRVVKVELGAGATPPTRVGRLRLNSGEDNLLSGVIDVTGGYAYFGTATVPARVVKVALGAGSALPTRVATLTLNNGEDNLLSAVIDTSTGYALFGTYTSPGRVVKVAVGTADAAPTRVAALTLNSGEDYPLSAVIDTSEGYAYFGTDTSPGQVVKVALGAGNAAPTRTAALTLNSGENYLATAVIDVDSGPDHYAYFGTYTNPGRVVKVALGTGGAAPTHAGSAMLDAAENNLQSAVIDTTAGYALFGTDTSPGLVVKVALGTGGAAPSRAAALTLNSGENNLDCAVFAGGYAYFGAYTSPGQVVKVAMEPGGAAPSGTGAITLNGGEDNLRAAVIDATAGYAYFGTDTIPGRVVKVNLGTGGTPPSRTNVLTLNSGEDNLSCAAIDAGSGYAYFGTDTIPGRVVKVALGTGASAPSRTGAVTLNSGEDHLASAVIDLTQTPGYAYFGTITSPGRVVKVNLGTGASPPSRVNAVTLNSGEDFLQSAVIDTASGYAYFGTYTSPARVVKVELGAGASTPIRTGSVTLNLGENRLLSAVIDPAGYAYFGSDTVPGRVIKIALGSVGAAPTRVGALILNSGEDGLRSAGIAPISGFAFFGTATAPGQVVKVHLGAGSALPTRVSALTLNSGEDKLRCAGINTASGYIYFGTDTISGRVVKVGISEKGYLKATKTILPEVGTVSTVSFYSHSAIGNLRLAIYDGASPRNLVWEAGPIANTVTYGWIDVPISSGSPSTLTLPPGTYWLGWQIDTNATVPSRTSGVSGDGLFISQAFGPAPSQLNPLSPTTTDAKWSMYVAYAPIPPPQAITITPPATGPTNAASLNFTVTFDHPVINFNDLNDLVITHTGTVNFGGAAITGGPATYTVNLNGITGDGDLTLKVKTAAQGSDVNDSYNQGVASSVISAAVLIDHTPPDVTLGSTVGSLTRAPFTITTNFSEPVPGFNGSGVSVSNGGTMTFLSGNGANYSFTVTPGAQGSLLVQIPAGILTDPAGNPNNASANVIATNYDSLAPGLDQRTPDAGAFVNALASVSVRFNESVSGVTAAALSVNGAAATGMSGTGQGPYVFTGFPAPPDGVVNIALDGAAIVDAAGNPGELLTWEYYKDSAAIQVALSCPTVNNGDATNVSPMHFAVAFSQPVDGFAIDDLIVTGGTAGNLAGSGANYSFDLTPSGQGAVSVRITSGVVTATAPPNNPNAASSIYNFTYDTQAPTVAIGAPSATLTNQGPIDFPVTITGASSINLDATKVTLTATGSVGGLVSVLNGTTANPTVRINNLTGDGTFTISIAAGAVGDQAGNLSAPVGPSAVVTVDNTPPDVTLSSAVGGVTRTPFTVSAHFSDPMTGFNSSGISLSNGATVTLFSGSGRDYSWTVNPSAQGALTVQIPAGVATGPAGNPNNASANIIATNYDSLAPMVDQRTPDEGAIINALASVSVRFNEPVSGVTAAALSVNGAAATGMSGTGQGPYVFTGFPAPPDGVVNIALNGAAIVDAAGNAAGPSNWSYTKDSAAVTATLSSPAVSNGGATNVSPIHFDATFSEVIENFALSGIVVSGGIAGNLSGSDANYGFDVTPNGQGSITVAIGAGVAVAVEPPNNPNAASSNYAFTYDTLAPAVIIGLPSLTLTNQGPVDFPVTITGVSSINLEPTHVWMVATGTVVGSVSIVNGITPNPTVTISGLSGDGTFKIYALTGAVIDEVGNPSPATSLSAAVTVDNTPPNVTLSSAVGNHTRIPFTVLAHFSEAITGFNSSDVIVSNGATVNSFSGGGADYSWTVTPSTQGPLTVLIPEGIATGPAGNPNNASTNIIETTYDSLAPAVDQTTPDPGVTINALANVSVHFTEPVSGVTSATLTVNGAMATAVSGTGRGPYVFTGFPAPADGLVNIALNGGTIVDAASNPAEPSTWSYTKNSAAVIVTLLSATVSNGGATNVSPIPFTATFSEAVSGFAVGGITVVGGSAGNLAGSGANYTFNVTPSGQGIVAVSIADGVTTATFPPNNANSPSSSYNFIYDTLAPTVAIGPPSSLLTGNGPIDFPVTIVGASLINLDPAKVMLNATGTAAGSISVVNGTTNNPVVRISSLGGDGTFTISITAGAASDQASNASAGVGPSAAVTVDNMAPTASAPTDAGVSTLNPLVTFNWVTPSDNLSGVATVILQIGTSPNSSDLYNSAVTGTSAQITGAVGQTLYARLIVTDFAGNQRTTASSDGMRIRSPQEKNKADNWELLE